MIVPVEASTIMDSALSIVLNTRASVNDELMSKYLHCICGVYRYIEWNHILITMIHCSNYIPKSRHKRKRIKTLSSGTSNMLLVASKGLLIAYNFSNDRNTALKKHWVVVAIGDGIGLRIQPSNLRLSFQHSIHQSGTRCNVVTKLNWFRVMIHHTTIFHRETWS